MTMDRVLIGLDIGGTNVKIGLCAPDHTLLAYERIPTTAQDGPPAVVRRTVDAVRALLTSVGATMNDVTGCGVGAPGPIDHARGRIVEAPNLDGWVDVPLADLFADALSCRTILENDANVAAYGEFVAGAAARVRNMVMLTLGTGIGGGVIADGRLIRGAFGSGGEIGHLIVEPDGRPCPCGQRGCLERYASANAIAQIAAERLEAGRTSTLATTIATGKSVTSEDVARAAAADDPLALEVWQQAARYLALATVNLHRLLNPEQVVFAGGVIAAGPLLFDAIQSHFDALNWDLTPDKPVIAPAQLGEDAGLIGAAALAHDDSHC